MNARTHACTHTKEAWLFSRTFSQLTYPPTPIHVLFLLCTRGGRGWGRGEADVVFGECDTILILFFIFLMFMYAAYERGPPRLSIALRIHQYCQQTFMLPQDDRGEDPHVLYSSMHRYCHAKTIRDCIQVCIGTVSRTLCYHAKTT